MSKADKNNLTELWKVDTAALITLALEQTSYSSVLLAPMKIFQSLIIQLANRALELEDEELLGICKRLCLIEPGGNDE